MEKRWVRSHLNDLRDGKLTFPMIYARAVCTTEERTELERLFSLQMDEAGAIEWIEALLERYQIQTHCRGVAQEYADHAKSALNALLPETPARAALAQLADYGVSRDW